MDKNMYQSNVSVGVEPTFFGKVMSFFALAMLVSAAGTYVGANYLMSYFYQYPAMMWVLYIGELALIFTSRMWSTKTPINRFLFAAFAFITGVTIAPLIVSLTASAAGTAILFKALGATGLMFGATALIGYTTKMDLSGMRVFLLTGVVGMIIVGIIGFFIPWSNTTEMIYSGIGVLLFSAFTAYDFQTIKRYPEDRYIDAALNLYLDIFNLFLMILRFMSANKN